MTVEKTVGGRVVLPHRIIEDGAVSIDGGKIVFVGERRDAPFARDAEYYPGCAVMPGFVDIHCHAGGVDAKDGPAEMAEYHLAHGTTSLLCTFYRGFSTEEYLEMIGRVGEDMKKCPTLRGVHMEGPYLNPRYGAESSGCVGAVPRRADYLPIAETGLVRQWTFAPEVEGTDRFLSDITEFGIVPAIGHTAASPAQVKAAVAGGARIFTHIFDATGCAVEPSAFDGTVEMSASLAGLLCDELSFELICDSGGIHVRPEYVELLRKFAGPDRIIGITDHCLGGEEGSDVNVVNGELYGSRLTMDLVAKNLFALGFSLPEISRITALNPARAVGLQNVGALEVGYAGDLVILRDDMTVRNVMI